MKSMFIPKNITKIDSSAPFATDVITVDKDNPSYTVVDGVLFTKDMKTLVNYPCNLNPGTSYTVPDGVERIDRFAFAFCNLQEIILPDSVKIISPNAFYGYSSDLISFPKTYTQPEGAVFTQGDFRYQVIDGGLSVVGFCGDPDIE